MNKPSGWLRVYIFILLIIFLSEFSCFNYHSSCYFVNFSPAVLFHLVNKIYLFFRLLNDNYAHLGIVDINDHLQSQTEYFSAINSAFWAFAVILVISLISIITVKIISWIFQGFKDKK